MLMYDEVTKKPNIAKKADLFNKEGIYIKSKFLVNIPGDTVVTLDMINKVKNKNSHLNTAGLASVFKIPENLIVRVVNFNGYINKVISANRNVYYIFVQGN